MIVRSIKEIISERFKKDIKKYIAYEFQDYGVRLSEQLDDSKRKAFYIKLAKNYPRNLLEKAKEYALDYSKAKSKARIFMWFLRESGAFKKT